MFFLFTKQIGFRFQTESLKETEIDKLSKVISCLFFFTIMNSLRTHY